MASVTSTNKCFGGEVVRFEHDSTSTATKMVFSVFFPEGKGVGSDIPVLYYLSGLTCTDQNFITKAGAQRAAAKHGIALVAPDTSPRGAGIEGEDETYDFGTGAGFYVNATREPWAENYNMFSYITEELPAVLAATCPNLSTERVSIMGHSMGGHGALMVGLRTGTFKSISAFAPIVNPCDTPWGQKALGGYLGDSEEDKASWAAYDSTRLVREYSGPPVDILIDQGTADQFLGKELQPEKFVASAEGTAGVRVTLRMQEGYDHSYYFISTFVDDHVAWAAERLRA
jgi:S-formylglutathione hydrolase